MRAKSVRLWAALQDSDNQFERACTKLRYPEATQCEGVNTTFTRDTGLYVWKRAMQRVMEFRSPPSEAMAEPLAAPPAMEPILAVVDSLSRTLNCIKTMCATEPSGPIRDALETDRANLVIGLFAARVAAMRLSSGESVPESASSSMPVASRG